MYQYDEVFTYPGIFNINSLNGYIKENSLKLNEYIEKYVNQKKNEHKRILDIKLLIMKKRVPTLNKT